MTKNALVEHPYHPKHIVEWCRLHFWPSGGFCKGRVKMKAMGVVHFYCAPYNDFGHPYRLNERKKPYHHRRKKFLERKNLTLAKISGHLEISNSRALNRLYDNKTDQQIG